MPPTTIRGGRQITDGTIPYVDIQNASAARILGNPGASAATISEISLGTGLEFNGAVLRVGTNLQSLSLLSYSVPGFVRMTGAGVFTLDGGSYLTANQTITLTGAVTGSGTTGIVTTIPAGTVTNQMLVSSSFHVGTTAISLGRSSAVQTLTGVSIDGNAATATTVAWTGVTGKPNELFNYDGWLPFPGYDANTLAGNKSGFTYNTNAPWYGPLVHFAAGGYGLQFNASYTGVIQPLSFRTRNGDTSTWNSWYDFVHSGNYNTYSPTLTGTGATGTWGINITGTAAGETLQTVTQRNGQTDATCRFKKNKGSGVTLGATSDASLQAYSTDGSAAFMSFHINGVYAVNMGLDPDNVFRIGGWKEAANKLQMDMSGNLTMAGDITAYSDARVKTNVHTLRNALQGLLRIRGVSYTRTDSEDTRTKIGVIAQELLEVFPELVNQDASGMYNVSYGNMAGVFIQAFKEQHLEIQELRHRIKTMENR